LILIDELEAVHEQAINASGIVPRVATAAASCLARCFFRAEGGGNSDGLARDTAGNRNRVAVSGAPSPSPPIRPVQQISGRDRRWRLREAGARTKAWSASGASPGFLDGADEILRAHLTGSLVL
jgi:hypothetical protein